MTNNCELLANNVSCIFALYFQLFSYFYYVSSDN
jgi:hypothetical protein